MDTLTSKNSSSDQPDKKNNSAKVMIALGIILFSVALTATILFLMVQRGPLQI